MKKLSLVLQAELEIPDDWELVEHSSGIYVLKVGDRFVDFDIAPLVTASTAPDATGRPPARGRESVSSLAARRR